MLTFYLENGHKQIEKYTKIRSNKKGLDKTDNKVTVTRRNKTTTTTT
jgi:hypothetical protein